MPCRKETTDVCAVVSENTAPNLRGLQKYSVETWRPGRFVHLTFRSSQSSRARCDFPDETGSSPLLVHAQHVSLIIVLRVNFRAITMYSCMGYRRRRRLLSGVRAYSFLNRAISRARINSYKRIRRYIILIMSYNSKASLDRIDYQSR